MINILINILNIDHLNLDTGAAAAPRRLRRVQKEAAHLAATLSDVSRLDRIDQSPGGLIERLAGTGYREGIGCVREHLRSSDARVRASAARALGRLRAAEASEELIRLAANEEEPVTVRIAAVHALGRTRDVSAAESLMNLMAHGTEDLRAALLKDIFGGDKIAFGFGYFLTLAINHKTVSENCLIGWFPPGSH